MRDERVDPAAEQRGLVDIPPPNEHLRRTGSERLVDERRVRNDEQTRTVRARSPDLIETFDARRVRVVGFADDQ